MSGVGDLSLPHFEGDQYSDAFQNYVIRTEKRDALRAHLRENGVETLVHWPRPVWEHEALKLGEHGLPETVSICREVVSLHMSAETTEEQVAYTVKCIREFYQ